MVLEKSLLDSGLLTPPLISTVIRKDMYKKSSKFYHEKNIRVPSPGKGELKDTQSVKDPENPLNLRLKHDEEIKKLQNKQIESLIIEIDMSFGIRCPICNKVYRIDKIVSHLASQHSAMGLIAYARQKKLRYEREVNELRMGLIESLTIDISCEYSIRCPICKKIYDGKIIVEHIESVHNIFNLIKHSKPPKKRPLKYKLEINQLKLGLIETLKVENSNKYIIECPFCSIQVGGDKITNHIHKIHHKTGVISYFS